MSNKPTKAEVITHFRNAKEVRCVQTGKVVDIDKASELFYSKGVYTIGKTSVVLWNGKYAEIVKKKEPTQCNCEACNCTEKHKLVKRNPRP
jgi:hypothetical protein